MTINSNWAHEHTTQTQLHVHVVGNMLYKTSFLGSTIITYISKTYSVISFALIQSKIVC